MWAIAGGSGGQLGTRTVPGGFGSLGGGVGLSMLMGFRRLSVRESCLDSSSASE